jgi:hypothetical protein
VSAMTTMPEVRQGELGGPEVLHVAEVADTVEALGEGVTDRVGMEAIAALAAEAG